EKNTLPSLSTTSESLPVLGNGVPSGDRTFSRLASTCSLLISPPPAHRTPRRGRGNHSETGPRELTAGSRRRNHSYRCQPPVPRTQSLLIPCRMRVCELRVQKRHQDHSLASVHLLPKFASEAAASRANFGIGTLARQCARGGENESRFSRPGHHGVSDG